MRVALALLILLATAAPAAAARDPIDHTQPAAPDGTPVCAKWVHDRYTVERGGRSWATWHPPRDPRYRCAFGHEHGSNPRAFRFFGRTGMPAFGPIGAYAGSDEPHPGFKVFVVNDDRKGLAWMMVLHQGSGSPRRHGALPLARGVAVHPGRSPARRAHTRHMADFGAALPQLPRGAASAGACGCCPTRAASPSTRSGTPGSTWAVRSAATPASRSTTRSRSSIQPPPTGSSSTSASRAAPRDPAGWGSYCKGDKRTVLHPRWGGPQPRVARAFARTPTVAGPLSGFLQVVSLPHPDRSVAGSAAAPENAFVMERPSDGGIYRAGRGLNSTNFEFPGYCLIRSN